ncbi:MAG TPA: hypothetical protein VF676_03730 [Flavobacterium sp.]|jgi:hypothetical protein
MKKINVLLCSLAIASFGFTSCEDDDDTNEAAIAGTYTLREVNTQAPTDFDEDGTPHTNQREESDCYDGSKIVLRSDQTFTYQDNYILVDETNGTFTCAENTFEGVYTVESGSGSDAVITATYENNAGEDVTLMLTKEGNELSYTRAGLFAQYPDRDDAGGATYTIGTTEFVYRR